MSKGAQSLLDRLEPNFIEAATGVSQGNTSKRKPPSNVVPIAMNSEPDEIREGDQPTIPLTQIVVTKQCRKHFDEKAIRELADTIKVHGLIQPIVVRPRPDQLFELVAGERRFRAAKLAGLREVPAFIRNLSDEERTMLGLIENISREDLRPMEAANAFDLLMRQTATTKRQLAKKLGLNHVRVTRSLSLLKLHPSIQDLVDRGEVTARHARELARIDDHDKQRELVTSILDKKITGTETEQLVQNALAESQTRRGRRSKAKARGLKRIPFGDTADKVTIFAVPKPGASYHDVEEALVHATEEVQLRIKNRVSLG